MKRKFLTTLAVLTLSLMCLVPKAYAKTDGYVVKDNTGKMYMFNYSELKSSFLALNDEDDEGAKLYKEYIDMISKYNIHAFHDDTGKYIDYNEILNAFMEADNASKAFNVNNFTENVGKAMTTMPKKIMKVTSSNNKIVYTEVDTASSSSEEVGDLEVISIE